jgi:hypothetical protein
LQGITFTAGVPSLTALGTAATSNSGAFQPAITGVANEVFGGTGPGMVALTSSYLPLSSMGTITGGIWNGTAIARAYGGLNTTSAGTGLLRDGTTPTASEISGDCTTSGSNAITCTKTNGTSFAPSATTDTTNASNISTGTLGTGRLPNTTGYTVIDGNGNATTVASGATAYFGVGATTQSSTEAARGVPMPFACTIRGFYFLTVSAQSAGGTLVATVRVGSASPAGGPAITIAASGTGGLYSDTADIATIAAGQGIDIQVVNNGSGNSAQIAGWGVGCVPN